MFFNWLILSFCLLRIQLIVNLCKFISNVLNEFSIHFKHFHVIRINFLRVWSGLIINHWQLYTMTSKKILKHVNMMTIFFVIYNSIIRKFSIRKEMNWQSLLYFHQASIIMRCSKMMREKKNIKEKLKNSKTKR